MASVLERLLPNAYEFTKRGLGYPEPFMYLGGILWIATILLAAGTAMDIDSSPDSTLYGMVSILTGLTIVPLLLDYRRPQDKFWTFFTVEFGSFAYLTSVGLWSRDPSNPLRLATFAVQTQAVSIQLAAIFNQARAPTTGVINGGAYL
jgi:FtsH-binding integral membrane protein